MCLEIEVLRKILKKRKINQKFSFWIIQKSALFSVVSEEISAFQLWVNAVSEKISTEIALFQRWFLALKISVFSAVQRFSGNEQRWNRPESILNQSWSALNVSETSTRDTWVKRKTTRWRPLDVSKSFFLIGYEGKQWNWNFQFLVFVLKNPFILNLPRARLLKSLWNWATYARLVPTEFNSQEDAQSSVGVLVKQSEAFWHQIWRFSYWYFSCVVKWDRFGYFRCLLWIKIGKKINFFFAKKVP